MALGFSVAELLAAGRKGARLTMGLRRLEDSEWLQPRFDRAARAQAFNDHPEAVAVTPQAEAAGREVAAMLGAQGGLERAARSVWEDLCLLQRDEAGRYCLTAGAVAFPTDWEMPAKIGLPLLALHAPIHGYAEQLARSVDTFMETLAPGPVFGRANWFVVASDAWRYMPVAGAETLFSGVTANNAGERLFIRCERQTLRRMPDTGAILFTIGIAVAPLAALERGAVLRLIDALRAQPEPERNRRGVSLYLDALTGYGAGQE